MRSTGSPPTTIGPYPVHEQIGQGGMATVYRATDPKNHREVALKVLAIHLIDQENAYQRFMREAQTLTHLHHPNILPVYGFGEDQGVPYLVMKLLPGRSLKHWLQGVPLPPLEVSRLAHPIASALDYAHRHGVIHRDVKPSNILLDDDDKPYLADFGVVYLPDAATRLTTTGAFVGTIIYASPEQCRGEKLDYTTDIYSLGVMVYEMLTGQPPFQGNNQLAIIRQHMEADPPNPLAANPSLPVGLYSVLARAMAKVPNRRYPSAARFSQELDEALGVQPLPEKVVDENWLYDQEAVPVVSSFIPQEKALPLPAPHVFDPAAGLLDHLVLPPESPPSFAPPQPHTAGRPAPLPAASRRSIQWDRLVVYGSIVLSLVLLVAAAVLAYTRLHQPGLELKATYRSDSLTFNYPAGWSVDTTHAAVTLADQPVTAAGSYQNTTIVIRFQVIDPVVLFGVQSGCKDQIRNGPFSTFECMRQRGYATPVYQLYQTSRYKGVKLPGTIPPTEASWPIILLKTTSQDSWLAIMVVYWNQYPDTYDLLDALAQSVRVPE